MGVLALVLSGCASQPTATTAQLSALFSKDSARWETLNANYQDCVTDWFLLKTGECCYAEAKELVASAKGILAEYETLDLADDLRADGDGTIARLQDVIDGDITKACGSGTLPDANLSACGDAVPDWVAPLKDLVGELNRW